MNIRSRLSIRFTLIVASILVLFSLSIYFFSSSYREQTFYKRLKDKALTTAKFLIEVKEIDLDLLRIIDKNTIYALPEEEIVIYDSNNTLAYKSIENSKLLANLPASLLKQIREEKEVQFKRGKYEVIGILYNEHHSNFIVIASAIDKYGYNKLYYLRLILIVGLLLSIIITLLAGWIYSGQALRPILKVINQVDNITEANLNLRVDEGNGTDEIAQLAITFNHMLGRLENAFISQRNFVSNASHELRTPLTSIMGQIEVALINKRNLEEYESILASVLEDIKNLSKLSNSLLDLAQATADISKINLRPLRIDDLLWKAREELLKAQKNYFVNIHFEDLHEEEQLELLGNEQLLKTSLLNLMDNACKFSEDKKVEITLTVENHEILLRFTDSGIGIEEQELSRIFEPMYRATNAKRINGHGLGLSLTEKIISLHQGKIKIQSKLNEGTTVWVTLPTLHS